MFWCWGKAQCRVRAAQVQTNSKRAARQCEPRRLFAPRKALCCARRRKPPFFDEGLTRRLRRESGTCRPYGFLANFGARRFPKGGRKALWCARRRIPVAPAGPDAPTPAREWDLPSHGALTLFFRWRKKSVQKKASGTATPGKSPLMPIFERGSSQCRARRSWIAISYDRARSCSLFSSFKKGKAFSLRCLSPLVSPAVGAGQT